MSVLLDRIDSWEASNVSLTVAMLALPGFEALTIGKWQSSSRRTVEPIWFQTTVVKLCFRRIQFCLNWDSHRLRLEPQTWVVGRMANRVVQQLVTGCARPHNVASRSSHDEAEEIFNQLKAPEAVFSNFFQDPLKFRSFKILKILFGNYFEKRLATRIWVLSLQIIRGLPST